MGDGPASAADQVVDPPRAAVETSPAPPRRRRLAAWLVATTVCIVVLAVLLVANRSRRGAARLEIQVVGQQVAYSGTSSRTGIRVGGGSTSVDYRQGGALVLALELVDPGSPGAVVTEVDLADTAASGGSLLRRERTEMSAGAAPTGWVPLASAVLGRRGRWFRLTLRFVNCEQHDASMTFTWDTIDVTSRSGGRTKHESVPFPEAITVRRPVGFSCQHP